MTWRDWWRKGRRAGTTCLVAAVLLASPGVGGPARQALPKVLHLAGSYIGAVGRQASDAPTTTDQPPSYGDLLDGVSCHAGSCVAVGWDRLRSGTIAPLDGRWDGSRWGPIAPSSGRFLTRALSCPGPRWCMAIGQVQGQTAATKGAVLVERWDGRSWASQVLPLPSGTTSALATAVSCATQASCQLVGIYFTNGNQAGPFADGWDGSNWGLETVPTSKGLFNVPVLTGISCPADNFCEAVGTGGGDARLAGPGSPLLGNGALIEVWDGRSWRSQYAPDSDDGHPQAVSCASASFCEAVGVVFKGTAMTDTWDGDRWSGRQVSLHVPAGTDVLNSLSCISAKSCVATGSDGMGAAVVSWDGTTWRTDRVPGGATSELNSVSCSASRLCAAVGVQWRAGPAATTAALAEAWNGASWSEQSLLTT